MKFSQKIWLLAFGVLGSPFLLFLIIFFIKAGYELMGYHAFNYDGDAIAKIAEEKNDPSECSKIRVIFHPATNTHFEAQQCAYTLAQNTLDPSVCELLLPTEYGLSCLSSVWGKIIGNLPCVKADGKTWVLCDGEDSEGYIKVNEPQINNCSQYKRNDLKEWCYTEISSKVANKYFCSEISTPSVRDHCQMRYAFKQKDLSLCVPVQNELRRKFCEIEINTWLKYPELRNSSYFGTPVPIKES